MLSNNAYTQEYFDIMESLGGDIESRRAAYDYMKNSTAIVHHQVISTSTIAARARSCAPRSRRRTAFFAR